MIGGSFHVGQRLTIKQQAYRIYRDLGDGIISLEELSTGRFSEHSIVELLASWKAGDIIIGDGLVQVTDLLRNSIASAHLDAFRQSYSAVEQEMAKARLLFVERLQSMPRSINVISPLIDEIWDDARIWKSGNPLKKRPHFTTVVNWINAYKKSGNDIRSLIDCHHLKGNKKDRHGQIVATIVSDLIHTRYLRQERPSIKVIYKEARGIIAKRNATRLSSDQLSIPSYSYIKARILEIAPFDVYRARYGLSAAKIKFRTAGSGVSTTRPLERAAMDHCRMDLFVVDESSGLPLGRPWITVIIDECTRYVLGYYLGFEEPSNVSMARALRNAISPKDASTDVENVWDAWGVIETLAVDNGMEFHGRLLEAGAGRYGITIQFCPRRKPWYKGKIERFFGTVNTGLLADMQGKTFSSVLFKGDYNPESQAVISLDTLRRLVHLWIVDVYHQEVHSALGMSPANAWSESISQVDRYLPPSSLAVETAFSASCRRVLTHKGIEFDSLFYNSPDLGALRQLHGSQFEVEIRTWDDDLGHLIVVCPNEQGLLKIPAVNIEYASGLTRWQHKVCKRYQRRLMDDDAREIGLLEARNRIRMLIEDDMRVGKRRSRKSHARYMRNETVNDNKIIGNVAQNNSFGIISNAVSAHSEYDTTASDLNTAIARHTDKNNKVMLHDDLDKDVPVLTSRVIKQSVKL